MLDMLAVIRFAIDSAQGLIDKLWASPWGRIGLALPLTFMVIKLLFLRNGSAE